MIRRGRGVKEAAIRADMIKLFPATAYSVWQDPLYREYNDFRPVTNGKIVRFCSPTIAIGTLELQAAHNYIPSSSLIAAHSVNVLDITWSRLESCK
jgi:hypothetical protein